MSDKTREVIDTVKATAQVVNEIAESEGRRQTSADIDAIVRQAAQVKK